MILKITPPHRGAGRNIVGVLLNRSTMADPRGGRDPGVVTTRHRFNLGPYGFLAAREVQDSVPNIHFRRPELLDGS